MNLNLRLPIIRVFYSILLGNTNSGKNVLDDWIPWPDIGQKSSASVSENPSISPILSDLSPPSQAVCRQISEMGFDLSRVAKGYIIEWRNYWILCCAITSN